MKIDIVKKGYETPSVDILSLGCSHSVLTGSLTSSPIKVATVTVEDYSDGFGSDGGFKDISFD